MNVVFDKANDSLIVTGVPLEATKMSLVFPEYTKEGQPSEGQWVHTASAVRQGTLIAVKEELTIEERPVLDEQGNQIDTEVFETLQVTPLDSQIVDLKVH